MHWLWLVLLWFAASGLLLFTATAGVVVTPSRTASPPAEQIPAARAASRNSPDARGSRPTTMAGRFSLQPIASMKPNTLPGVYEIEDSR